MDEQPTRLRIELHLVRPRAQVVGVEVYKTINDCFRMALSTTAYVSKSLQDKPNMTQPSAAILNDGKIKVLP